MQKCNRNKQNYREKSQTFSREQANQWKITCNGQKFQRKRYFIESAKQYIDAVQSDQLKRQQFKRKYLQHIQSVAKAKLLKYQQMLEQRKRQRTRKKQMRQLRAQIIKTRADFPCRRSGRNSSRDMKSLASSELDEQAIIIEPSKSLINNQTEIFFKAAENHKQAQQIQQQKQAQVIQIQQIQEKCQKLQNDVKQEIFIESYEQNSDVFQPKLNGKQESQDLKQIIPIQVQPKSYTIEHLPHADRNLLKIQQKIDKYIIYNRQTRLRSYVYIDQLINYINESENFFFNRKMFEKLQSLNENLYKTQQGLTKQTLLIRGKQLSNETVKQRFNSTLSQLIKLNFGIQCEQLNKQEQNQNQKIHKVGKKIIKDKEKSKKFKRFSLTKRILRSKDIDSLIATSLDNCFKNISNN